MRKELAPEKRDSCW